MIDDKVMLCFYEGAIQEDNEVLNNFDADGFIVHAFDSIDVETLGEINLENIITELFGKNYTKKNINVISNIETLIIDLFKRYSWDYNSFIYDNLSSDANYTANFKDTYNYNFNLFAINEWSREINYNILEDRNIDKFYISKLENFMDSIKQVCNDTSAFYGSNFMNLESKADKIRDYIMNDLNNAEKEIVELLLQKELSSENDIYVLYMASFALYTFKRKVYGDKVLHLTLNSENIDKNNRFFIMYQLISKSFTNLEIEKSIDGALLDIIYEKAFDEFREVVEKNKFIPKKYRDENLVLVFVSQFTTLEHGPTKTALDRCYSLMKYMNKRVILINTKELITAKGAIPINNATAGAVMDKYETMDKFSYKDVEIPYYQPSCSMPDEYEIASILNFVSECKPYFIINIGGNSITADLCSELVPMATISTSGNFAIGRRKGQFFIMGRRANESDYKYIAEKGYKKDAIIESTFTYTLKEQEHTYSRRYFGIPDDKFVVTIIGGRLQKEVDEEFISVLDKLAAEGSYIISIGGFTIPDKLVSKYKNFAENFKDIGFQTDILACVELTDLYLNPKRQGGGGSAVECMFKGKPSISLKYGDVSVLVNNEALVNNYHEMIEMAEKCKNDKEFYAEMSNKARLKAADLMDSEKYFKKMYYDIVKNPLFK